MNLDRTPQRALLLANLPWGHPGLTNRQAWAHALHALFPSCTIEYVETIGWGCSQREFRPDGTSWLQVVPARNAIPCGGRAPNVLARRANWELTRRSLLRAGTQEVDLVVVFDPLLPVHALRGLRAHVIYDCLDHYDEQPQFHGRISRRFLLRSERALAKRADRVIVSAPGLARRPTLAGTSPRVLFGALTRPGWADERETATRTHTPPYRAVYVGALDPYKVDIQALTVIADQPWLQLTIVGRREFGASTPELDQLRAHPGVRWHNSVPRPELGKVLMDADFGVVAMTRSRYSDGSFPLKVWDYMWAGIPVLAAGSTALQSSGIPGVLTLANMGDISKRGVEQLLRGPRGAVLVRHANGNDVIQRVRKALQ